VAAAAQPRGSAGRRRSLRVEHRVSA